MLTTFGQDIWLASGTPCAVAGFVYPTRMAVIRLGDDGLFIWSPVALTEGLRAAVDALGIVRWVVAPNTLHHLHLAQWQDAYPSAELHGPKPLHGKRADIRFSGDLQSGVPTPWTGRIDFRVVGGNWITTEVVFHHVASRTVLFTDLLQQFDRRWFTGWRAIVAQLDDLVGDEPRVPRKFRYAFFNRRAARRALDEVVDWQADRLFMAHGRPLVRGGRAAVRDAFRWLSRSR